MIKLIATDIDGTILKDDFTFNPEIKSCINTLKNNGIKIVLVTGRMHCATIFIAEELGIDDMPVVSYQGGLVMIKDKILYERYLEPKSAIDILNWAKTNNIHINLYINDKLYVEKDNEIIQRYATERKTPYEVADFSNISIDKINKLLVIDFNHPDKVTDYKQFLSQKHPELHIVKSTPFFCEVCHGEATKKNAVDFLKNYWNLKDKEVMAIGDQNNDISLLKAGGIKIAMGNATPELKSIADFVTDTVDNNGFIKAIDKFVYNKVKN